MVLDALLKIKNEQDPTLTLRRYVSVPAAAAVSCWRLPCMRIGD